MVIAVHPVAKINVKIPVVKTARELEEVIVSVGWHRTLRLCGRYPPRESGGDT
jgi:hypothetical protein